MLGFNYAKFKEALKRVEEQKHLELRRDIEEVKAFVEKALTMFLDSTTNMTRVNYPGLEL